MPVSDKAQQRMQELYKDDKLPLEDVAIGIREGFLTPKNPPQAPLSTPSIDPSASGTEGLPSQEEARTSPAQVYGPPAPTKPWYQQSWETLKGQTVDPLVRGAKQWQPIVQGILQPESIPRRLAHTPMPEGITKQKSGSTSENLRGLYQEVKPTPEQLRMAMEIGGPILYAVLAKNPAPLSAAALQQFSQGMRMLNMYGPPLLKALGVGSVDALITQVANMYVDPEHPHDPISHGLMTGGLEYIGGILGTTAENIAGKVGKSLQESQQGKIYRQTIEGEGGQFRLPGMTTGNPFLRSTSSFFEHMPGGKAVRTAKEEAQQLTDDALRETQEFMGQRGEVSKTVQNLNPSIPQKTTLDLEPILRPYFPMGDPNDIAQVPKIVEETLKNKLKDVRTNIDTTYQALDSAIEQTPIPWHFGRKRLPIFKVEDVLKNPDLVQQGSPFHVTENILKALESLPDDITLNTARDAQSWLRRAIDEVQGHLDEVASGAVKPGTQNLPLQRDLQYKVLPALGQSMQQLNEWITPHMVDMRFAQREAEKFLKAYEAFPVPEAGLLRGQMTHIPGAEDPHIVTLREFFKQEPYATFQEAQKYRSKFGEVGRQPGPNLGNETARTGERMADLLKRAMTETADHLGPYSGGGLTKQFRAADTLYHNEAQVWNSPLLMEASQASLDDILKGIVRNERPNDLRQLRQVLGEDVWRDIGEMWKAQAKEAATDRVTKVVDPQKILDRLGGLTKAAEEELFPLGLNPLRRDLERTAAMQELLTSTDALRTHELLRTVGPTTPEVKEIGAVRLSQLAEKHTDARGQINAEGMLKDLRSLGATERELYGNTLAPLKDTLEKSAALQRAVTLTDPTLLTKERTIVNDPQLWRAVQSEKLAPGFQIHSQPHQPDMLDGKYLVDHLNKMRSDRTLDAVFPDQRVVDHLYHLGQTAQVLAEHVRDVPFGGRHYQPLVRFTEGAAIVVGGFATGHLPALGGIYLTMQQLTKVMTNPNVAKWLTTGMRTPINARHAGEVLGALTGALAAEGIEATGDIPLPPPGQP